MDSWRRVSAHKRLWSTLLEVKDTLRGYLNYSWHRQDKNCRYLLLYAHYLLLIIFSFKPQFHDRNSTDILYQYPCLNVEGCLAR